MSPGAGPLAGQTAVTITGGNFTGAKAVKFGASDAVSFSVSGPAAISAVSPAGTGTVDVTVTTAGGTSATGPADRFRYVPAPVLTKLAPTSGPVGGGSSVTITGANLAEATSVMFGATSAATFTVKNATTITAISPPESAGAVDVTVSTAGGTSQITSEDRFKFTPTVTGVSPNSSPAAGGTNVTVSGTGFAPGAGNTVLEFGSKRATSVNCSSTTTCTAVTRPGEAGTVDVRATVNKVTSAKNSPADQFTFN